MAAVKAIYPTRLALHLAGRLTRDQFIERLRYAGETNRLLRKPLGDLIVHLIEC